MTRVGGVAAVKRAIAIVTLACALFASGVRAEAPPEKTRILVWHAYRAAEETALLMLIDQFNAAHPEYRAEALALPYDVYPSKLSAAIPTGHGPDVFIFAQERVSAWARDGLLSPMDADAAMMPGEFPEAALDALRSKGALWGLPLSLKSVALYVNKSLVPVAPVNTDEMVALAQKLTDPAQGRFGLAWEAGDFYHHASWLSGFGGKLFKEPEHRPVVDTPEGVAALTFVRDLMRKKHVMPEEPSAQLVATLFNANRAAMVINGPWFAGEIHGVDYEVVSLPIVSATGLPARPLLTVEAALVSATSEVKDGARALARFLVSKDASILRAKIGRQVVATRSAYDDPGVGGDTLLRAFRKQAESAVPMDNTPAMLTVWEPYKRALTAVLSGLLEPDEALAQAQRRLNAIAKPMPPPASPWPLLLLAAGGILALSIWIRRRPVRPDAPALYHDVRRAIAYCTPAAASILVLVFIPFAIGVGLAFFHHGEGRYTFVGLSNFVDILTSRDYRITEPMSFWFTLAVTLAWTVANVVLHVSIGLFLALLLRDPLLKFKGVYRVLLIVPWAVPNYITALVWKGMFHRQFGAISALLATLGLEPVSWFTRFSTSFAANVVTNTWLGFPFMMVVSLGALQSIPQDLYEAAEVDGASKWAQFRHITLPLLRPALLPAVILGSVWTFNMFNIIYLVSGGEPGGATDILVSEAYRWAFQRNEQFGFAAAYSTLIFLFLLGWSALTRRVAREPSPEAA